MFGKKKSVTDTTLVDEIMKNLQADDNLYSFGYRIDSPEYGFAVNFPDKPAEHFLDGGIGVLYQLGTPDGVAYSIGVFFTKDEPNKEAISNDLIDGVADDPRWHEYSSREIVGVDKGHAALTQTFKSNDDMYLMNTTLYTERFHYIIQVQNVYFENAALKLSHFIDTFELI